MPPKAKKAFKQPKIKGYTEKLRSRSFSAPSTQMEAIYKEEQLSEIEKLDEDADIKELIAKVNEVCGKVDKIEKMLMNEETGLKRKMADIELKVETGNGKQLVMTKEYKVLKQDLTTIKGTIHRHYNQINALDSKVVDLTARSMAQNFVISGIIEDRNENCTEKVRNFLTQELGIVFDDRLKIKIAHRIGVKKENVDRAMVVKVNLPLKEEVMKNIELLEGRTNAKGKTFYMNLQQPEARVEAKRNAKALLKKFQKSHKDAQVEIRGDKVYVNKEWQRPYVRAPNPKDTFYDPGEQKELNKLKIIYTPPKDSGLCTFWGAAIRANSTLEVQRAYNKIRQEHSELDHISVGYVAMHNGEMVSGLVDDKEYGAGYRILRQIRQLKEQNLAVFVARKFGGVHLGAIRFESIENAAKRAIEQINTISPPRPTQEATLNNPRSEENQKIVSSVPPASVFRSLPEVPGSAS